MLDASRRIACKAALVVRPQLAAGLGDLGFALRDGTYVPLLPAGARSEQLLQALRAGYARAKAEQLADVAHRRFQASVHRSLAPTAA